MRWLLFAMLPVLAFAQDATPAAEPDADAEAEADADADADPVDVTTVFGRRGKVARLSGSAHAVDAETLENEEVDDVHRLLGKVPGVYVRDEEGFGLRPNIGLRGAASDRSAKVTLMEDGVLLAPAPYAAPAAYYFPVTTRMVGVEVFKGPASIRHGPNTIGGAVNMRTRAVPRHQTGGLDVAFGEFESRKLHGFAGDDFGRAGILVEAVQLDSAGFKELDGGGDTGFEKAEVMLKMRYETNPEAWSYHRLELKLGYSSETSRETYLGLTEADFEATPYRRYAASQLGLLEWDRSQAQVRYDADLGDSVHLSAVAYRHDFRRVWRKLDGCGNVGGTLTEVLEDGERSACYPLLTGSSSVEANETLLLGTNDRDYLSQGVQLEGEWRAKSGALSSRLTVGARLHHDEVRKLREERDYRMVDEVMVPDGDAEQVKDQTGSATAWAFHALEELGLWKRWYFTPGLRVELIDTKLETPGKPDETLDQAVLIPGVGTYFQVTQSTGVFAGVHRGFSPVTPGTGDAESAQEPEPEQSLNYEVGARLKTEDSRGELVGFFNDYSNLTGRCTQSAACRPEDVDRQFNAGEVWVYGAEVVAGHTLRLPGETDLSLDVTYTLTVSDVRGQVQTPLWDRAAEEGDALPYVPEHQAQATLAVAAPRWGSSLAAAYVGEMRDQPGQGSVPEDESVEAHTVLDLSAYFEATERARLYAKAENLLDSAYVASRRPFGLRPGKPRQVWVGFKYRFGED